MHGDEPIDHPREALSALIDGELPAGERGRIEEHIAACAACRAVKEDLERLVRAIASETVPPPPADLAARIRARLAPEAMPAGDERVVRGPDRGGLFGWRLPRITPMPAAAAAAVMVAALVWMAWPGGRPSDSTSPTRAPQVAADSAGTTQGQPVSPPAPMASDAPSQVPPPSKSMPSPDAGTLRMRTAPTGVMAHADTSPGSALRVGESVATEGGEEESAAVGGGAGKGAAPEGATVEGDVADGRRSAQAYASAPPMPEPKSAAKEAQEKVAPEEASAWQRSEASAAPEDSMAALKRAQEANAAELRSREADQAPLAAAPAGAVSAVAGRLTPGTARVLNAAPYTVRLLPGTEMNLKVDDYSCTVPIAADDAFLLLGLSASPPDEESAQAPTARQDVAPGAAAGSGTSEEPPKPGTTARKTSGETPAPLSPEARRAVLRMVRERYRAVIEARCGPLPR